MQVRATHFMSLQNALYSIPSVQRTLSLRGATRRGNLPKGTPHYKTHARYFCTCVEKKAQTSIRVSVIAPDNVISKAQLSGTPRDTVYPWGKGAHKQKSEHYCPPIMRFQKCSVRRAAQYCVNSSVLLTHFTEIISPIRVNGTLFWHFSIIRQSNSYL